MTLNLGELVARIEELNRQGRPYALATVIRTKNATSAKAGAKAIIEEDGSIFGWLGGGCVQQAVRAAAAQALSERKPRMIRIKPSDEVAAAVDADGVGLHKSGCPSGGTVELFVEPMAPRAQLVLCGGSPITKALADLARWLGFSLVIAAVEDDQAGFAAADHRIVGFDLAGVPDCAERYVVVATQGKRDGEALRAALGLDTRYIAFVGSRAKVAALKEQLAGEGIEAARLDALHSPAGLDIGAIGPEEIALSVFAEIVQARRRATAPEQRAEDSVEGSAS